MQAEGALKAAQLNIEFTHVMAPITGRVSRHLVTPAISCRAARAARRC